MPDFEIVSTIEKNQTTTNDKEQVQATIHDSASNTSLS